MRAITLGLLAACGNKGIDQEKAAALYTAVPVATAPGLSGLAVDDDGALWTVAERDAKAFLIRLDNTLSPAVQEFSIDGVPANTDLESVAWLSKGRLAFGTESKDSTGGSTILIAEERGPRLLVIEKIQLPADALGLRAAPNHGSEGLCGIGDTLVVAIEETGSEGDRRWAPIVRLDRGQVTRSHRLWLTSSTGKLSGLDCQIAADGSMHVLAVERHFDVTHLLTFALPSSPGDITPSIALDLGPVINGKLNLEGIAWTPRGVVAVIDNQYGKITGPSELLVFKKDAVR